MIRTYLDLMVAGLLFVVICLVATVFAYGIAVGVFAWLL